MKIIGKVSLIGTMANFVKGALFSVAMLAALSLGTTKASAQGVLTIDDTDPSHVVIIATGNNSAANSTVNATDGIDLLSFFTSEQPNFIATNSTGSLVGGNSGVPYNVFQVDTASGASVDLNLYLDQGSAVQTFSSTQPAFAGQWVLDLSAFASVLPTVGTTGNVMSGYSGTSPDLQATLGTWQIVVVPEPGTTSLALVGFAMTGFAVLRHRRQAGKK